LPGEYAPDNGIKDDSDFARLRRSAPDDMLLKLVGIVLAEWQSFLHAVPTIDVDDTSRGLVLANSSRLPAG
jgi:hypothetical protein